MNHSSFRFMRLALFACLLAFSASGLHTAHAQSVTILHSFGAGSSGNTPEAGLILGSDGNFYGTASEGGNASSNGGLVFKITPSGTIKTLHKFGDGTVPNDGIGPYAGLIQGSDGNFYGTTVGGGTVGHGVAYKMTPSGVVTILHDFGDGSVNDDANNPYAPLVQGSDGNFYGTSPYGGVGAGAVFKMTPSGTVTILHSFGDGSISFDGDGAAPFSALIQGADGSFYGTTSQGGIYTYYGYFGSLFKITSSGAFTVLYNFGNPDLFVDGSAPYSPLVLGRDGNFYGTTVNGGSTITSDPNQMGYGTAFKMTPSGTVTILHSFGDGSVPNDGNNPYAALVQGTDGNFYGTTTDGGFDDIYGTAFKMTPAGAETVLHLFHDGSVPNDGYRPYGTLVQGVDGNFYGTTVFGGAGSGGGFGTVYRLTPPISSDPAITSLSPTSGPVGSTVIITGTNFTGVTAVRFHDKSATTFSSNADGTHLAVTVPPGAEKGTITVTTPNGSATTATPFRVTYAPVIVSFSPASGPVGTVVVITGTHLSGITRVRFHEADATVYSSNADGTQLTVTVPPGAATGTITLDNRDVLATTSSGIFTVTP